MLLNPASRVFMAFSLLIIAFVAVVFTFSHMPYGAAVSTDSLAYLSAAKQFAVGNGFSLPDYAPGNHDYYPLTIWPPLYPWVLASFIPTADIYGIGSSKWVGLLNIISLFVLLSMFWMFTRKVLHPAVALLLVVLLALLPSFQVVYMYTWSESIFIPLVFAAFCLQWRYLSTGLNWFLWVAVVFLALAFNTRYAGLGFFGAFLLNVFLFDQIDFRQKIIRLIGALGLYTLCNLPWVIRNYIVSHTMVGVRADPIANWLGDVISIIQLLQNDLLPYSVWVVGLALIFIAYAVWGLVSAKHNPTSEFSSSLNLMLSAIVWVIGYLGFLVVHRQVSHSDLDPRMMAPIMPLVLLALALLINLARRYLMPATLFVPAAIFAAAIFFNAYGVHRDIIESWKTSGTPGVIMGVTYNSSTNHTFDGFRAAGKLLSVPEGGVLLTDINRPQILHYYFPAARVKQLPADLDAAGLKAIAEFQLPGYALIITDHSMNLLREILGGDKAFLQIKNEKGEAYPGFILLKLPLTFPDQHNQSIP